MTQTKKKVGRPKKIEPIEKLDLNSFQEEITLFKIGLLDYLNDDDRQPETVEHVSHFLSLPEWQQNLFIVYTIFKQRRKPVSQMADILQTDRLQILKEIKKIKTILKKWEQ